MFCSGFLLQTLKTTQSVVFKMVRPTGIEPVSSASEADALSIGLWAQNNCYYYHFIILRGQTACAYA